MKNYALLHSEEYVNMRELVADCANKYGDKTAYSYRKNIKDKETIKISYKKLGEDVCALGTELIARGYTGKHVAVTGKMSYNWICSYLALISAGAVIVPLDAEWEASDLASTVAFAECEYLFSDREMEEKSAAIIDAAKISNSPFLPI